MAGSKLGLKFPLFGIPVTIDASFLIFAALIGFTWAGSLSQTTALVLLVLVSILWHELGHAVALRAFGHRSTILIHGFGGLTASTDAVDMDDSQSIVVSLAGPIAGVVLGLGALAVLKGDTDLSRDQHLFWTVAVWINLVWSLANLAPVLPLDGGHVMERLVHVFAPRQVDWVPQVISILVALPLAIAAALNNLIFAALFLGFFAATSVRELLEVRSLRRQATASRLAGTALETYRSGTDIDRAIEELSVALGAGPPAALATECRRALGWAFVYRNGPLDMSRVTALADGIGDLGPTAFQRAAVAWRAGDRAAAYALWTRALAHEGTPPPAWYAPHLGLTGDTLSTLTGWLDQLPADERTLALRRLGDCLGRAGMIVEADDVLAHVGRS